VKKATMTAKAQGWQGAAVLLVLGTILVLGLFLMLRPLRMESPASAGARAMLRLDGALGATVEPLDSAMARDDNLAPEAGYLVITSVASKGAAASAGLRVGDVIEQIDGRPASQISSAPAAVRPISVWRGGKETIVNVQFATGGRSRSNSRGTE
jgi:hypothetical protein